VHLDRKGSNPMLINQSINIIAVRDLVYPRVIVLPEGLSQCNILMTPQGIEPATFRDLPTFRAVSPPNVPPRIADNEERTYNAKKPSVLFMYTYNRTKRRNIEAFQFPVRSRRLWV
jgi:hypothetical protein